MRLDDLEHRAAIRSTAQRPDVRAIFVDSLRGAAGGSENSSEFMEAVLWLAELARDAGKPVVLVHHLRKPGEDDRASAVTLDRLRGSSAIVQPARVIWAVDAPDPDRPTRRRLSVIKSNLARFAEPIGFDVTEAGVEFGDAPEPPRKETQVAKATDLLLSLLADGPVMATDIFNEARQAGVSERTVRNAKKELRVVARKRPGDRRWEWALPAREEQV